MAGILMSWMANRVILRNSKIDRSSLVDEMQVPGVANGTEAV